MSDAYTLLSASRYSTVGEFWRWSVHARINAFLGLSNRKVVMMSGRSLLRIGWEGNGFRNWRFLTIL